MANQVPVFRRGGRPKKPELQRRALQINARVSPDEMAAIERRAASTNRGLSEYVRELALSGRILVRQFRTLSAIDRHDLARIGSNLNQIARVLNQTGDSTRARNIELLLAELRALLDRLDTIGETGRPDHIGSSINGAISGAVGGFSGNATEDTPDELGEGA